jgi:hypothetical protein
MRSQNIFMLGLCVAVVAGITYFAVASKSPRQVLEQIGRGFSAPRPAPAPEEPAEEPKKKETAVKQRTPRNGGGGAKVEPVSAAAVVEPAAAPRPPAPQPAPGDIRTGTERAELLRQYPAPALQTSTIKDEDLVELIVYQKEGANVATFVQLQNGVVTMVYAGLPPRKLPR